MEQFVTIKSGRYNLVGILTTPNNQTVPCPLVIMCHGFTGTKSESHFIFTKTARFLVKKNISSLRFDFMGSGDSEGSFEKMTLKTQIKDGENVVKFLSSKNLFDPKKIGALGLSMGAVISTHLATLFNLKSQVLWSPLAFPGTVADRVELTPETKKNLLTKGKAYFPDKGLYIGNEFLKSTKQINPLENAKDYKNNVLIIHTKDDQVLTMEHPLAYFKYFHKKALMPQLLVLDEGGHTFKSEFSEKTVIEETASFFVDTLF
ncbi:alpha/beta hydrolase [bacterium]|nr:alpha/beta hydrolase [bacterium]